MFTPESTWSPPAALPDLRSRGVIALDTETRDIGLASGRGSGWHSRNGHVAGVSVAWWEGDGPGPGGSGPVGSLYVPIQHPETTGIPREVVGMWLRDLVRAGVRIVTQGALYDWGWLQADLAVPVPPGEQLDEVGAAATIVDENRFEYGLDALCRWRGLPGKDEGVLREAAAAYGYHGRDVKANLWRLPARYVAAYAEADAVQTLRLHANLMEVIREEHTWDAYRLECDLLPMVLEMRRRGIRVDVDRARAEQRRLLAERDRVFADLRGRIGERVGMEEIGRTRWLERIFQVHAPEIIIPRTATGLPSFTAGTTGWMHKHPHWLPQLVVRADKLNNAAQKFIQGYLLDYAHHHQGGDTRIHAEVHPHRSDDGGTRSLRFSYSDPPLQQMTSRDEELAPAIRGCLLPERGEKWGKPDYSQQEYRLIVHFAALLGCRGAQDAVRRYVEDPETDFHKYVVEITGLERRSAKDTNFAKAFGAGIPKFAAMINKSEEEAEEIYNTYDEKLPFVSELYEACDSKAQRTGFVRLLDGARSHFSDWEPKWLDRTRRAEGWARKDKMNPCPLEEARERTRSPEHAWHGARLKRADTRKAMNRLIQGSAARQTKMWMMALWREGIVPLLQMHDELDVSVADEATGRRVVEIGRDVVRLQVPVQVEIGYGQSWADAKHAWDEVEPVA